MIPTIDWLILCHKAESTVDGTLNLLGVFNDFAAETFPIDVPQLYFAFRAFGEPSSDLTFAVEGDLDGEKVLETAEYRIPLDDFGQAIKALTIDRIPVTHPGKLTIMLVSEGHMIASTFLSVSRL
jgi:hypothetical protein